MFQILRHLPSTASAISSHSAPCDVSHCHLLGDISGAAAASAVHSASGAAADRRRSPSVVVQLATFSQHPSRLRLCRILSRLALERRLHARLLRRSLHSPGKTHH